jgi:MOSC domain-containing protein YiiM
VPQLLAVCVVHALRPDAGTVGVTAIDKRAWSGEVKIGPYGVRSDIQADRKSHGGLGAAVYAYSDEDAAWWSAEVDHELEPGWFGENLRVEGIDVSGARIGERWRIGAGEDAVELEVTRPRRPCQTFARWAASTLGDGMDRGWVKRFQQAERPGAYLQVIRTGSVSAGDPIEILSRPEDAPTIAEVFRVGEVARVIRA